MIQIALKKPYLLQIIHSVDIQAVDPIYNPIRPANLSKPSTQ